MHFKSVFVFFSIVASTLLNFTAHAYVAGQDSVKKVYVKVTAAEKPLQITEDAFFDNATSENSTRKYPKAYRKPKTSSAAKMEQSNRAANTTSAHKEEVSTTTMLIKKADKPTPVVTADTADKLLSVDKDAHEDEVSPAQTTDDTAVSNGKHLKTSKTYMWIGIVLVVVGIIMGILFGKTALLISLAGMVFVIIGYAIK